ncbi:hypothetical protein V2J09_022957 [Rumex salicifolius]
MADALLELAQVMTSKDGTIKLTKDEAQLLLACRSKALRDATLGGAVVSGLVWITTGKLSSFFRTNLVGGLGFISGVWSLNRSVDSCVDHILSLEGTRMKHELARIVVRRYGNDPRKMHLISKHFYSEEVFDDSASDQPRRMFRQRSMYVDNAAQIQRSPDTYGHEDSEENRNDKVVSQKKEVNGVERFRKTAMEFNQGFVVRGSAEQDDPLDYLLGYSDVKEEALPPISTSDNPTRQQTRRQRRLHRHHRLHRRHRERDNGDPSTMEDA